MDIHRLVWIVGGLCIFTASLSGSYGVHLLEKHEHHGGLIYIACGIVWTIAGIALMVRG